MPTYDEQKLKEQSESVAEAIFLIILIVLIGGPISGLVLTASSWVSTVYTRGASQVESTKNLADKVFKSSERIRELEHKLTKSELELSTLRRQAHDTKNLRSLLGLKERMSRKTIAAEVVARNPDNWFERAVLDKGESEGILKGSAVITADGVVGQVVSTSEHAAVVRLITDPEQKIGVLIKRIGLPGIISGNGQKLATIDFVPVGTNVDIGDKIVCFGKGLSFPENHPVGEVVTVRRDTNGASMQIDVKLAENCYDLSQVLVLPPFID
ncbi:MAG: rod shape-determining protein MreC [Candidatus Obscuribacterales bacterium]|nr:rod shape-determining protein MreC [Candidatus Obscuribacterales bacterium]